MLALTSVTPQKVPSRPGSQDALSTPYVMPANAAPNVTVLAKKNCHGAKSMCQTCLER